MKLDFAGDRVLAVVAHPDDAELLCAGTLARAREEGASIGICVLCQGDKGQPSRRVKDLAAVRSREMKAAARIIGASLFQGGIPDSTLCDGVSERMKLVEILRQFRPTLLLAHAPEDYHADHQAASRLAEGASWFCASKGQKTKSAPLDAPPAVWFMDTINMNGFLPGFYVDISRHAQVKERMLNCHASQLARGADGDFSPLTELMQLQFRARGMQSNVAAAEAFRIHDAFKRVRAW